MKYQLAILNGFSNGACEICNGWRNGGACNARRTAAAMAKSHHGD